METRIAVVTIIVEDDDCVEELNHILHQHAKYIVGRLGLPYRPKDVSVICVVLDAPQNTISSVSGKIGMLKGITSKTVYSKVMGETT